MKNKTNNFTSNNQINLTFIKNDDLLIQEWLFKDTFDIDNDNFTFINFMEEKYNLIFDKTNWSWKSTNDNDIMAMEDHIVKEFNKYVSSYNSFITVNEDKKMPRLTKECELLYKQQSARNKFLEQEIKIQKQEAQLNQQLLQNQINNLTNILISNGIKVDINEKEFTYVLTSNLLKKGQTTNIKFSDDKNINITAFCKNNNIVSITQIQNISNIEFEINAKNTGKTKIVFISEGYKTLEIDFIIN
ncbi:hypothetical protein [Spiroplasma culicicola]|uniref:Uncharacterized protein n=1 Tax=Spiroplasma culicicola AES-1 TaxID=1276246 RepID=W6A5Q3_9MOLU|nr:hypothetical protein [Spiroplasma culicicola]AHI52463.1 hypothetical protein SCULI_v1c01220 [Spiroplasma culicicola AES-1]